MSYYFSKILNVSFDEAISKVMNELKKEGFGILTEIDVKEALKKKLNVDYRKYKILGACSPPFAYQASLLAKPHELSIPPFASVLQHYALLTSAFLRFCSFFSSCEG